MPLPFNQDSAGHYGTVVYICILLLLLIIISWGQKLPLDLGVHVSIVIEAVNQCAQAKKFKNGPPACIEV